MAAVTTTAKASLCPPRELHKPVSPLELLALEPEPLKSTPRGLMQRLR